MSDGRMLTTSQPIPAPAAQQFHAQALHPHQQCSNPSHDTTTHHHTPQPITQPCNTGGGADDGDDPAPQSSSDGDLFEAADEQHMQPDKEHARGVKRAFDPQQEQIDADAVEAPGQSHNNCLDARFF